MDLKKWFEKISVFFKDAFSKFKKFYTSHKKLTLIGGGLILVAVIGLIVLVSSSASSKNAVTYRSAVIKKGDITQAIDVVGNVAAVPSAVLNWQTSGIVGPVNVKVGDQVKAGDVLVSLLDSSVSSTILDAKNSMLAAQLTLAKLQNGNSQFQTATQTLAAAQVAYAKALALRHFYTLTGVSDEVIDAARMKYYDTQTAYWTALNEYEALYQQSRVNAAVTNGIISASPTSAASPTAEASATPLASSTSEGSSIPTVSATPTPAAAATSTADPAVAQAYDAMKAAQLTYNKASRNLNYLIGNGYGNNNSIEAYFLAADVAKAALAEAQATWDSYRNGNPYVLAAQASVQALQNTIDSSKIVAPFDGTVTDILSTAGDTVASAGEAVQMDDLTHLMITVNVSEADVNKMAVGQDASITFAAVPNTTYKGALVQIGNAGSSSSGVVQFRVTIQVLNADAKVKPGFSANVSIVISSVTNVLLVPNIAISTTSSGRSTVLVNKSGVATPVVIQTGAKSDTYTEVTGGNLKEGDTVMIATSSLSSASASNRALFSVLGGGGGGGFEGPQQPRTTTGSSSRSTTGG